MVIRRLQENSTQDPTLLLNMNILTQAETDALYIPYKLSEDSITEISNGVQTACDACLEGNDIEKLMNILEVYYLHFQQDPIANTVLLKYLDHVIAKIPLLEKIELYEKLKDKNQVILDSLPRELGPWLTLSWLTDPHRDIITWFAQNVTLVEGASLSESGITSARAMPYPLFEALLKKGYSYKPGLNYTEFYYFQTKTGSIFPQIYLDLSEDDLGKLMDDMSDQDIDSLVSSWISTYTALARINIPIASLPKLVLKKMIGKLIKAPRVSLPNVLALIIAHGDTPELMKDLEIRNFLAKNHIAPK